MHTQVVDINAKTIYEIDSLYQSRPHIVNNIWLVHV